MSKILINNNSIVNDKEKEGRLAINDNDVDVVKTCNAIINLAKFKNGNKGKKRSNGKNISSWAIIQEKAVKDLKLDTCVSHDFKGKSSAASRKGLENMVDKPKLNSMDKDSEAQFRRPNW